MDRYLLKLYVAGQNLLTERAILNLKHVCETRLKGEYQIIIVDILESGAAPASESILAIPAVVREWPLPVRRVVGDLSDADKVLIGLDILPAEPELAAAAASGG